MFTSFIFCAYFFLSYVFFYPLTWCEPSGIATPDFKDFLFNCFLRSAHMREYCLEMTHVPHISLTNGDVNIYLYWGLFSSIQLSRHNTMDNLNFIPYLSNLYILYLLSHITSVCLLKVCKQNMPWTTQFLLHKLTNEKKMITFIKEIRLNFKFMSKNDHRWKLW